MRFAEWGELAFHRWLAARFGAGFSGAGFGDDAALLKSGNTRVAVTTDAVVEGVHFRRDWFSWAEIGRRAVYGCLSDLAAVCAQPLALLLSLGVPEDLSAAAVRAFTNAVAQTAAEYGARLAGGDTTQSKGFFADLVAVGETKQPWLRSGAQIGDALVVTGALGAPTAAIALLEKWQRPAARWRALRNRLAAPRPRIIEAQALACLPVHAALDISDGLLLDASRLAAASGLRAEIRADLIPLADGVAEAARALGRPELEFAAGGGEEYELLIALAAEQVPTARQKLAVLNCPLTVVGHVVEGSGAVLLDSRGVCIRLPTTGWEHYGGRPQAG